MSEDLSQELAGQTAVVTGSSSGIGQAIALELASAGAHVLVHARARQGRAEQVAQQVRAKGGDAEVLVIDLSDVASQDQLVETAWEWRTPSIWINNAGVDVLTGDSAQWSFERKLEELWRVDVVATMRISRQAGDRMRLGGGGVIVNMGWDQALTGMAGDSGEMFSATKGAIMAFSRSLAKSLAPEVRVNCLAPGWIRTAWGETASDVWQRRAKEESLLKRWGTPDDIARVCRFLVSPASAFMTGQTISINGGRP